MSEKHTDAQGEYGDKINRLCWDIRHAKSLAWRDSLFEQLIELIDPAPCRATEGQAQTSAAVDWRGACESIIDIWDDAQKNPPESRCYMEGAWPALIDEIRTDLAAQLADSTAPAAPTAQQSITPDPAHLVALALSGALPDVQAGEILCAAYGPTAQQSLTTGGAVPADALRDYADKWLNGDPLAKDALRQVIETRAEIAAAPLPQVQSEALDRPAYPEGDVVGACVCGSWPGGKCLKCPWIPATNQQPVTPSGALADNDGGVAK